MSNLEDLKNSAEIGYAVLFVKDGQFIQNILGEEAILITLSDLNKLREQIAMHPDEALEVPASPNLIAQVEKAKKEFAAAAEDAILPRPDPKTSYVTRRGPTARSEDVTIESLPKENPLLHITGKKTCDTCGKERPTKHFRKDESSDDGHFPTCKFCVKNSKNKPKVAGDPRCSDCGKKISGASKSGKCGKCAWNGRRSKKSKVPAIKTPVDGGPSKKELHEIEEEIEELPEESKDGNYFHCDGCKQFRPLLQIGKTREEQDGKIIYTYCKDCAETMGG